MIIEFFENRFACFFDLQTGELACEFVESTVFRNDDAQWEFVFFPLQLFLLQVFFWSVSLFSLCLFVYRDFELFVLFVSSISYYPRAGVID